MQKLFSRCMLLFFLSVVTITNCYAAGMLLRNPIANNAYSNGYLVDDSEGLPLFDMHGAPWYFEKYRGRWIIVSYWASYCPPCLSMIPELNAIYRGREGKQAIVLGVNYDFDSKAEIQALIKEFNITYPVTQGDPAPKLGIASVDVLPMTIIITPEGRVYQILKGVQTQVSLENYMRRPEDQE